MLKAIHDAEELTKDNTRGTLLVCLDYGGQQEIVEAVKKIAKKGIDPEDITPDMISDYLYAPEVPPPDLIIRTSGEQRLSNFLLWESAYSEFIFNKKMWPEYTDKDLASDIKKYGRKSRRFGK